MNDIMSSRYFNNICILNDNVIRKSSKQTNKMIAEYRWLESQETFNHPKVYSIGVDGDYAYYDMEYIHGASLSYLYVNKLLSPGNFKAIFSFLKNVILKNHIIGVKKYKQGYRQLVKDMYSKKTISRLTHYGIDLDTEITINDKKYPSLREIIDECSIDVTNSDVCYIHGDLCFSNILLDNYAMNLDVLTDDILKTHLYVIDPRGIMSDNSISSIGDWRYDIAKLAHSAIGYYDLIKSDRFKVDKISRNTYIYDNTFSKDDYVKEVADNFNEIFKDAKANILEINVQLFLSMIPLHMDNQSQQDVMIVNALRMYSEYYSEFYSEYLETIPQDGWWNLK